MKQSVLSHFDMPLIPITGLLIFVICFALYTFWTFRKSNKTNYIKASLIPLEEAKRASALEGRN